MAAALIARSVWTSAPRPVDRLTLLVPDEVRGIAVHWPGSKGTWGPAPTLRQTAARLEAERRMHTAPAANDPTKPWTDIAYSLGVDLAGRVFDARGIAYRPAANGDATVNRHYVAVTVLMLAGDTLTPAAVDGLRVARRLVLERYPRAVEVVGHRDLHPTDCPGDQLYELVRSGRLALPAPAQEDAVTPAEMDQLIERMAADQHLVDAIGRRIWTWPFNAPTAADPKHTETSGDRLVWASRGSALAPTLDTILGAVRTLADPERFAGALAAHLPAGAVDVQALARAVRAELGAALKA